MADGRVVCVGVLFLLLFHFLVGNIDINTPKPWTKKDFNILHQNIRGLFGKKDLLENFMIENNVKVIELSETLLNSQIPSSFVKLDGYNFERRDRGSPGGGIGMYIKNDIEYIRRSEFETDDIEFICLEVISSHTKSFCVCTL